MSKTGTSPSWKRILRTTQDQIVYALYEDRYKYNSTQILLWVLGNIAYKFYTIS